MTDAHFTLDAAGVADFKHRFGELHDSVLRAFSCSLGYPSRVVLELEALDLRGAWFRMTLTVGGVTEFRFAEGVAIWANETHYELSTVHPDRSVTRETKTRDLGDLRRGGPSNVVLFAAAIHVVEAGVFVDLSPENDHDPYAVSDPAAWRRSSFYVFGREATVRLEAFDATPA